MNSNRPETNKQSLPTRQKPHIVHTSAQAINLTQDHIEKQNEIKRIGDIVGVPFGIDIVDRIAKPTRPRQLVCFIGRPANGKTFLMQVGFLNAMKRLHDRQITNKNCVWISYEESLEEFTASLLSFYSKKAVGDILDGSVKIADLGHHSIIKIATLPFIFIGHSDEKSEDGKVKRPKMTMEILNDALDYVRYGYRDPVTDSNCEIELICLDYLQRMHKSDSRVNKVNHFEDCVDWSKDTALWGACPFWLGVQSGRQSDSQKIKIPSWEHAQYTSNVEQSGDVLIATWMPKNNKYEYANQTVPAFADLPELKITDDLLYFKLLKQKKSPAPKEFALRVQPHLLTATNYLNVRR